MLRQNDTGWCNPKVLGILAVIFVCGMACGSAVTRVVIHRKFESADAHRTSTALGRVGWQKMKDELQLTPAQVQIVAKELDDYAKYYQNIEDQREDVAAMGTQHILNVLTPDQKQRFYKLLGLPPSGVSAAPVSAVR